MKIKNKILMIIFWMGLFLLFHSVSYAGEQRLNALNYDVKLNLDGNVEVIETWDIYVSETNTLFKTFELDNSKYSGISHVKVKDMENGLELSQIDEEMYHVTQNCYYALPISENEFEIAWGVGLDDSSENKIYQISYTILDGITNYQDCSEFYWQFVGKSNAMSAKKVTGTIKLPAAVQDMNHLRVWAHGPLNGEIHKISNDTVAFEVDNLGSKTMLETRIVVEEEMFPYVSRNKMVRKLDEILTEEKQWADEANEKRQRSKRVLVAMVLIFVVVWIWFLTRILKYRRQYKKMPPSYSETINVEKYYRDVPRERDATPAQAAFLYYSKYNSFYMRNHLQHVFSATLLDLCLKGYLSFDCANKEDIVIVLEKDNLDDQLEKDEKTIFDLLNEIAKGSKKVAMSELKKYANKNYEKFGDMMQALNTEAKQKQIELNHYDKQTVTKINFVEIKKWAYILGAIMFFGLIPISIEWIICAVYLNKIAKKMNSLTEQGEIERQQWKGLQQYMKDFSLLKEKEIPDLVLWEKYLVYATAFGISKEVVKQLKVVYPEFSDLDRGTYSYMYLMSDTRFQHGFINTFENSVQGVYKSYESAYSASLSSGSGSGGGFSGGGGGRWWWRPEWAEDRICKGRMKDENRN